MSFANDSFHDNIIIIETIATFDLFFDKLFLATINFIKINDGYSWIASIVKNRNILLMNWIIMIENGRKYQQIKRALKGWYNKS